MAREPLATAREPSMLGTFRSLRVFNYRAWAIGALVSNVGTWMQRMAQDWLVLTQLTPHNATAVGTVMALQFGPQAVLLPLTGWTADRFDRRKVLFVAQASMGALALGLGALTVAGLVRLWHVYVFALALGCVTAFDAPARQSFVTDLVGEKDLPNAVALNATSFHVARMIGPSIAGVLIASIGSGWVFLINGLSFVAVLGALLLLRTSELHPRAGHASASMLDGFRYVWRRADLKVMFAMLFLVGTFGLNFAVFVATMSVRVFHEGPRAYGLLTSAMAIGSVSGALLAARQANPRLGIVATGALLLGVGLALAALSPTILPFAIALVVVGASAQTFTTTTNATVQLSTDPAMRGRVMAIFLAIALGGTPIGAPIVGFVADRFGPRWSLGVGAGATIAAATIGLGYLRTRRR